MKIILVGGHPKGFDEPFHPKTASGRILRKIVQELKMSPVFFDLWKNQQEEDSRIISEEIIKKLLKYEKSGYQIISLGRYIEKALSDNNINSYYLPHPASRDRKYVDILRSGLKAKISEFL